MLMSGWGTCKMRGVGKFQCVQCGEKCREATTIYTYKHTLNECSSMHSVGAYQSQRSGPGESPLW